ncbi:MAG: hypothetical protein KY463_05855 [Actinobacteria bacterium]|nr:hypothetical protein [Actinomycetota bacterium]
MGGELGALAEPGLAAPPSRPSACNGVVMLNPRFAEASPPSAVKRRHEPKAPRAARSAAYVAYRRRSASGAIAIATGLAARRGR